jgi:hypothetical protein
MERMLSAFDQGIAIFVPITTTAGTAITANTLLGELQLLSEDEKKVRHLTSGLGTLRTRFMSRESKHCTN